MSVCAACPRQRSRASLSNTATTIIAAIAAMTFSASGAAPTPLYQQYQENMALAPAMLTIIFAAYVLCLLSALLTTGSLSDHIGRRPVILWALAVNIVAMIMFATADSAAALIAARAVQGFATGVATTALGAAILDMDRSRGAVLNSMTEPPAARVYRASRALGDRSGAPLVHAGDGATESRRACLLASACQSAPACCLHSTSKDISPSACRPCSRVCSRR
jgi:hypothetical protein